MNQTSGNDVAPRNFRRQSSPLAQRAWRYLRAPFSTRDWSIVLLPHATLDLLLADVADLTQQIVLQAPGWRWFWADPCVITADDGGLWLFVEEFDRLRGKGCIRALNVLDGQIRSSSLVLVGRHHRAFPRVWRVEGRWMGTVDGCEVPGRIYTFESPGTTWELAELGPLPSTLTDPDLEARGRGWALVGTNWMSDESACVEVWVAQELAKGDWVELKGLSYTDPAHGRGAGNADWGRGIRAVQEGIAAYGSSVSLIRWPVVESAEILRTVEGLDLGFTGTHTLAWTPSGGPLVADVWKRRPDPLGWLWKLTDLRHLKSCRASTRRSVGP